jgi:hypothetical protein
MSLILTWQGISYFWAYMRTNLLVYIYAGVLYVYFSVCVFFFFFGNRVKDLMFCVKTKSICCKLLFFGGYIILLC